MDFRTEWSSWVLVALMMLISYFASPWPAGDVFMIITKVVGLPLLLIALASIPVVIFCYFAKVIPDIDYSIRLAFLYFVYLLIMHFV